ncbi:MAG: ABC transporter ATP-binding protein [Aggregatilineales bacterium]
MNLLVVEHLQKSFSGLKATRDVSLTVAPQELSSIIGPNGAGKSTLFNQITGLIRPDSGRILFQDQDIIGMPAHRIVRLGIGRSFQRSNIFPRLTAYENVQVAVLSFQRKAGNLWRFTGKFGEANDRVGQILENVGLQDKRDRLSGQLALGDQKRLEIGLALALEPKLMLLDEPTAGMSPEETASTISLIEHLVHELKISLLFTEHDIAMVFGISQIIRVLHLGAIIAQGTPREISENPEVQSIYLGSKATEKRRYGVAS